MGSSVRTRNPGNDRAHYESQEMGYSQISFIGDTLIDFNIVGAK